VAILRKFMIAIKNSIIYTVLNIALQHSIKQICLGFALHFKSNQIFY